MKMNGIARAWNQCWFSRFDPVSVSVFRIFLGIHIIAFYLVLSPNWERFYAADGITSLVELTTRPREHWWSLFYWTEAWFSIRAFWWVGLVAAILFTLGWKCRVSTIVLYAIESTLLQRSTPAMNGEDAVYHLILFWGMFAPLGEGLSIDSWLKRRRARDQTGAEGLPTIWAVRAMQINFVLIYAISLPNKLVDDIAWWNGDAIYLSIVSNVWSRWPWPEMFYAFNGFLSKCFTYGTILAEGGFCVLVWFPRPRLYIIGALAALHIGIAVMLNGVAFFSLSMVCGLWLFVPPEVTRMLIGRISWAGDVLRVRVVSKVQHSI